MITGCTLAARRSASTGSADCQGKPVDDLSEHSPLYSLAFAPSQSNVMIWSALVGPHSKRPGTHRLCSINISPKIKPYEGGSPSRASAAPAAGRAALWQTSCLQRSVRLRGVIRIARCPRFFLPSSLPSFPPSFPPSFLPTFT